MVQGIEIGKGRIGIGALGQYGPLLECIRPSLGRICKQPGYICPADIDAELEKKLKHFAWRAHIVLNALDVSRTDIRLDNEGNPRLLEINTLPGLTPGYSDLCLQAAAEGISYEDLILEILYLGASRWGMVEPRDISLVEPAKKKTGPLRIKEG